MGTQRIRVGMQGITVGMQRIKVEMRGIRVGGTLVYKYLTGILQGFF